MCTARFGGHCEQKDGQTDVKTLPCPKLRLRAVIILKRHWRCTSIITSMTLIRLSNHLRRHLLNNAILFIDTWPMLHKTQLIVTTKLILKFWGHILALIASNVCKLMNNYEINYEINISSSSSQTTETFLGFTLSFSFTVKYVYQNSATLMEALLAAGALYTSKVKHSVTIVVRAFSLSHFIVRSHSWAIVLKKNVCIGSYWNNI